MMLVAGVGLECMVEARMRCGADGDPRGKGPRGMTWVWTPMKAGSFSSPDTLQWLSITTGS